MYNSNKIKGGLFGLIIGDTLGVPYEFYRADELPPKEFIEFEPPNGFIKAHDVKAATWSDDSSQALCLLESLLDKNKFDLYDFADKLIDWLENGRWAIDNIVFDIGMQTSKSLYSYEKGISPYESGFVEPDGKGNGALMRVLPLALWHTGTDEQLIEDAHTQCLVTHGHICNQACSALYCLVARGLLNEKSFDDSYNQAVLTLRTIYKNMPDYEKELEWSIRPDDEMVGTGGGYVIDCLRSTFMILKKATSYEQAVKDAVALGNDTDTTAAVTGGLAGILFGFSSIPQRWIDGLRSKEIVDKLIKIK